MNYDTTSQKWQVVFLLRRRNEGGEKAWLAKEKAERKAMEDREEVVLNLPLGGGVKLSYFCARNGQKLILTAMAWACGNGLGRKG